MSRGFYLSQKPFQQSRIALIDEQYLGQQLDPTTWIESDPASAISVAAQAVQVNGGAGQDGKTTVAFIDQIEMGGALELQHGDVSFTGASKGILGGLYAGAISVPGCLAGFQIAPSGSESTIQAVVQGHVTGPVMKTTAGHRYVLTTYVYSMEVYRSEEIYHSGLHPAGNGLGGARIPADVRFVLEVQEINPSDSVDPVSPRNGLRRSRYERSWLLHIWSGKRVSMQCSIAFTYLTHIALAEVRTALPDSAYATRLVESFPMAASASSRARPLWIFILSMCLHSTHLSLPAIEGMVAP